MTNRCSTTLALLLTLVAGPALAALNHPFGSHPATYAAGSIKPSHVTQGTLDQSVRDFYDQWKAAYVKQVCGPGRYVVEAKAGGGNLTVSEAHGYGMVLMALMAGHDPQANEVYRCVSQGALVVCADGIAAAGPPVDEVNTLLQQVLAAAG